LFHGPLRKLIKIPNTVTREFQTTNEGNHHIVTAIAISPTKDASSLNLENFSANPSLVSDTEFIACAMISFVYFSLVHGGLG
jgi:hypothetical protein